VHSEVRNAELSSALKARTLSSNKVTSIGSTAQWRSRKIIVAVQGQGHASTVVYLGRTWSKNRPRVSAGCLARPTTVERTAPRTQIFFSGSYCFTILAGSPLTTE